ncbi:hypothetical protein A7P94_07385 [Eikenella sp. NML01-A-086]|nr:hypothetical protein A7P94_07385 [Eikenella sp. NML01-A-086]
MQNTPPTNASYTRCRTSHFGITTEPTVAEITSTTPASDIAEIRSPKINTASSVPKIGSEAVSMPDTFDDTLVMPLFQQVYDNQLQHTPKYSSPNVPGKFQPMCKSSASSRLTGKHNKGATPIDNDVNAGAPMAAIIFCVGRNVAQNTTPPPNTIKQPSKLMLPPSPPPAIKSATPIKASSPHNQWYHSARS